jgi:hypothetical protein
MNRSRLLTIVGIGVSSLIWNVAGNFLTKWLESQDPTPARQVALAAIGPLTLFVAALVAVYLIFRTWPTPPATAAGPAATEEKSQLRDPASAPEAEMAEQVRTTRAGLEEAQRLLTGANRDRDAFGRQADMTRTAVDFLITWLYRRQNWHGLSPDGRSFEPAPREWAEKKYVELGLNGLHYGPPRQIPGEPGFTPPEPNPRGDVSEAVVEHTIPASEGGGCPDNARVAPVTKTATNVPPKAAGLPDGVWETHQKAEFCKTLAELQTSVSALVSGLQALPVQSDEKVARMWRVRVDHFSGRTARFSRTYWDEPPALPKVTQQALLPTWRQQHVATLVPIEAWFRDAAERFGCVSEK